MEKGELCVYNGPSLWVALNDERGKMWVCVCMLLYVCRHKLAAWQEVCVHSKKHLSTGLYEAVLLVCTCSPVWSVAGWWSPHRRRWFQWADWWPTDQIQHTLPQRGETAPRSFHWNMSGSAAETRGHRVRVSICFSVW